MEAMALVKIRVLVTVAILVSSTVLGCHLGSRNPSPLKTLQASMDDVLKQSSITQNVTMAVGNTLKITLGSNYSTPFRWTTDAKIGDSGIIKQTEHEFVKPTTDAVGAPGTEEWTFTALRAGTTTVSTAYTSFLGRNNKPACVYTANVTVQ